MNYWDLPQPGIAGLIGKTLTSCEQGGDRYSDRIVFQTDDKQEFVMFHDQECYEGVSIEDIVGDLEDLVGSPILTAEERHQDGNSDTGSVSEWTFYELATNKGSVTIRWYGESNGYYSTTATVRRTK